RYSYWQVSTSISWASQVTTCHSRFENAYSDSKMAVSFSSGEFVDTYEPSAAQPAWGEREGTMRTRLVWTSFAACSAASTTFELLGSTMTSGAGVASIARTISSTEGFDV